MEFSFKKELPKEFDSFPLRRLPAFNAFSGASHVRVWPDFDADL